MLSCFLSFFLSSVLHLFFCLKAQTQCIDSLKCWLQDSPGLELYKLKSFVQVLTWFLLQNEEKQFLIKTLASYQCLILMFFPRNVSNRFFHYTFLETWDDRRRYSTEFISIYIFSMTIMYFYYSFYLFFSFHVIFIFSASRYILKNKFSPS